MSSIGQRIFVLGGNQPYLTLANEEFVRPLGISNNWTKIRFGILAAQTPDGTNNLTTAIMAFGVCSGTTAPFGAASTTNFLGGIPTGAVTGSTITYNANSGNPYYNAGTSYSVGKRVANVNTMGQPNSGYFISTNTGTIQRRTPMFIDITKGSPNYTVTGFNPAAANIAVDYSFAMFMDAMEQTNSTPIVNGITMNNASQTVAASEVPGILDTVDIYWNKSSFPLEIYAMAAYRMQ